MGNTGCSVVIMYNTSHGEIMYNTSHGEIMYNTSHGEIISPNLFNVDGL